MPGITTEIALRVWQWWALCLLSVVALFAHGLIYYMKMPDVVPTRFDDKGRVSEQGSKEVLFSIYTGTSSASGFLLGMGALTMPLWESSFSIPHRSLWMGADRKGETLARCSRLCLIVWCCTNLLLMWMFDEVFRFGIACMGDAVDLNDQACHDEQRRQMWWPWVGIAVYVVVVLVLPYWEKRKFETLPAGTDVERMVETDADKMLEDEANWKCGVFYYCAADDRIFVPKRFGLGWTLNMAQAWGRILSVCIVGGVTVCVVASLVCAANECAVSHR